MLPPRVTVFDFEMPNSLGASVSSVGYTVLVDGKPDHDFYSLVNPESGFDPFTVELTGIRPEDVENAPTFGELWETIRPDFEDTVLVAHAAAGDLHVLSNVLKRYGIVWKSKLDYLCTLELAKAAEPDRGRYSLDVLCKDHDVKLEHHIASSDAKGAAALLLLYADALGDLTPHVRLFDLQKGHPNRPTGQERMVDGIRRTLLTHRDEETLRLWMAETGLPESAVAGVPDDFLLAYAARLSRRSGIQLFLDDLPHAWLEEDLLHAYLINLKRNPVSVVTALNAFLPRVKTPAVLAALHPAALDNRRELLRRQIPRWLEEGEFSAVFAVQLCRRWFGLARPTEDGIVKKLWALQRENSLAGRAAGEYFERLQKKAPERYAEIRREMEIVARDS